MPTHKKSFHSSGNGKWLIALSTVLPGILPTISYADLSEADYLSSLRAAEKKVARMKRSFSFNPQSTHALSSTIVHERFGRGYKVGDQWDVAAWASPNAMARMTSDPTRLQSAGGAGAIFHYEVVAVKTAPAPEVTLQVTQVESYGLKKTDPRVESLKLVMNNRMLQSRKTYQMKDRSGRIRAVSVAPEGIHSAITRLELFPLDIPELSSAEKPEATTNVPVLPSELQAIARQAGYAPTLAKCTAYEQDDFFGRGMKILWQQGKPWPAYLKTDNGVAILIHSGGL